MRWLGFFAFGAIALAFLFGLVSVALVLIVLLFPVEGEEAHLLSLSLERLAAHFIMHYREKEITSGERGEVPCVLPVSEWP